MTHRAFSDEDLTLFLDGEASEDVSQKISAALAVDASLASYLDELRAAQAAFVADQDALLSSAPPMPRLPDTKPKTAPWVPALVGLAAGLAIATVLSWSSWTEQKTDWRDVVANYQSLYVTETLAGVTEPKSVQDAKLTQLSEILGLDLTDLPEIDGLAYRRAQQLGYKGEPLAQLTFLTSDGGPVALCILRTDGSDSDAIQTDTLEGMAAYSWVDNGFGVLLIGPQGDATLPQAANQFRTALRDGAA